MDDIRVFYKRHQAVRGFGLPNGEAVLFHPDTGMDMVINPVARLIWENLSPAIDSRTMKHIVMNATEGADPESIDTDIADFYRELSETFMIIPISGGGPNSVSPQSDDHGSDAENGPPAIAGNWHDAPSYLDISLTHQCNLHCPYCFYDDEMTVRQDLTTEQWIQFFRSIECLPVKELVLSGGEVFTRKDLPDLLEAIVAACKRFSILTNGTLIDERWVDVLSKVQHRLSYVQFSIDGSCSTIHDRIRGRGSFEKTMRGLQWIRGADLPVMVRMTINRYNVDDIRATIRFLLEELGLPKVGTNDVVTVGAGCRQDIGLNIEQQVQAMKDLIELSDIFPGRIQASAGPLARYRFYRDIDRAMAGEIVEQHNRMGRLTSCGCMGMKLAIRHDGVISPCNMLSDAHLGQILTDSLTEVWQSHPILESMRRRSEIHLRDIPECADCPYADYCTGNCPAPRFVETGQLNLPNRSDCYRRFLEQTGGFKPWATR
ncbi:radical SAM protein [bacterium]|nr:radical SAM protein [candidate division CSSED10-310 bacterium]